MTIFALFKGFSYLEGLDLTLKRLILKVFALFESKRKYSIENNLEMSVSWDNFDEISTRGVWTCVIFQTVKVGNGTQSRPKLTKDSK